MTTNAIIGISGLAGDGKDSLCAILEDFFKKNSEYSFKRIALADKLKEECRSTLISLYGIDILNCSRAEKDSIRDFLIFYAKKKRIETDGKHWTSLVQEEINNPIYKNTIFCIPDIRHCEYQGDEVDWIKNNSGTLIHLKKFNFREKASSCPLSLFDKIYSTPINKEEKKNTPKVEEQADYIIEWQDCYPEKPTENEHCISCANFVAEKILVSLKEKFAPLCLK